MLAPKYFNETDFFCGCLARAKLLGYAFISADYQVLLPGTGHDILNDVRDVFKFIKENNFTHRKTAFEIDPEKIVVAGGSAGGHLAYLAAAHINPKPKGIVSLYAMGGDYFVSFNTAYSNFYSKNGFQISNWLHPKTKPFLLGQPLVDPTNFKKFLPPFPEGLPAPASDVPVTLGPETGVPTEFRAPFGAVTVQLGLWLDYYKVEFNPSLSGILRDALDAGTPQLSDKDLVPERHHLLFPTFVISSSWPPTLMLHGTADTAVAILSSQRIKSLLTNAGVSAELIELEGKDHAFDVQPNADVEFAEVFDKVKEFLKRCIEK